MQKIADRIHPWAFLPLKIAIVGSHGVGKTVLANRALIDLKNINSFLNVVLCPEIPRLVCESVGDPEYFRREQNSLEKQLVLLIGQASCEAVLQANGGVILCDRSILDHWAYTQLLFGGEMQASIIGSIDAFIKMHMKTYDLVCYIPIEFPLTDDGVREADTEFQHKIDQVIFGLLSEYGVPFKTLSGNLDARSRGLCFNVCSLLE